MKTTTAPSSDLTRPGMQRTALLAAAIGLMGLIFTSTANAVTNTATVPTVEPATSTAATTASVTTLAATPVGANLSPLHNDKNAIPRADNPISRTANSQEAGIGMLYVKNSPDSHSLPLLQTVATMHIAGIVNRVTFQQTFSNTDTQTIEGLYVFPLPEEAAIRKLQIRVGERVIKGMIRERSSAEKLYEAARENGRVVGLVKQQRPNLFSLGIANIAPGEQVSIELDYIQSVKVTDNLFSIRLPLTLTPRYSNALVTDQVAISPPMTTSAKEHSHTFRLTAFIEAEDELTVVGSTSHALRYSRHNDGYLVNLAEQSLLDRDVELHWKSPDADAPLTSTYIESVDGDDYLLGLITPPQVEQIENIELVDPESTALLQRELIMIIDTSGSMAGEPIETAITALLNALHGLNESDYFNIIEFDDRTKKLFRQSRPASHENISNAMGFIQRLYADGGTEMMPALRTALRGSSKLTREGVKQVVFITDGAVGYEKSVFKEISRMIGQSRLFTVGIGQAPNSYFMKQAAASGRGTFTYIPDSAHVSEAMGELFRKLEHPVMKDISIEWIGEEAELSTSKVRDLHAGEPLIFSARLAQGTTGFVVSGFHEGKQWQQSVSIANPAREAAAAKATNSATGVSTIWARKKIETLLDEMMHIRMKEPGLNLVSTGRATPTAQYSESSLTSVPEPGSANETISPAQQLRGEIIEIALAHQLVTPFTSLIAIDEIASRRPDDGLAQKDIPNLLPAGTGMTQITLPQGALGVDALWLVSLLSLILALMLGAFLFRMEHASYGALQ